MPARPWFLLAILGSLLGCGPREAIPPEPARWIRVALPESRLVQESYPLSGTVMPRGGGQVLAFLEPGQVLRAGPREGEAVRSGQELADLDRTGYAAALDAASAQTRAAQAAAARAEDECRRMRIIYDRQSLAENDFLKFKLAEQAAREQFLQAQANATVARKALADTSLRAPAGGVVTRRLVEPGVMVTAGQPAFEIAQTDPVEIQVGVPENRVGAMRVGQTASVTLPALPGARFSGRLRVLNAAADPASRTYMARIAVANPGGALRLGMIAEARIQGERRERMLLVPCDAIVRDPQGATLLFEYQPGANRVLARRVTVGALEGTLIQVRSGLEPGARIVVAGQNDLRDGAAVRVADAQPRPEGN